VNKLRSFWSTTLIMLLTAPFTAVGGQAHSVATPAHFDLRSYIAELGRWEDSARRLGLQPEEAAALRKQLPDHWSVVVDGQDFEVSTAWLDTALEGVVTNPGLAKKTSKEAGNRLDLMRHDAEALARLSGSKTSLARTKLGGILRRREFRSVGPPTRVDSLWARLGDWVRRFLDSLLRRAGGYPAASAAVLWGVVVLASLIFLGWLIKSLAKLSFAGLSIRRPTTPAEVLNSPGSWREWALQARAAAGRGECREAIRIIYGAAVRRIEEAGAWQVDPSRTHREYLRLLSPDSSRRPPLAAITTCFERVWYGNVPASSQDCDELLGELESLG